MCCEIAWTTQTKSTFNRFLKDQEKFRLRRSEIHRKSPLVEDYHIIEVMRKFETQGIPYTDWMMDHLERMSFEYLT